MTLSPLIAMPIALAGNACLSLGMVLQKKHVAWLYARKTPEGRVAPGFRHDVAMWMAGFVLMNLQPIFLFVSLFGLSANVAASAAGSSVAFTALFSVPLLGEKLTRSRIWWTLALFGAIALAGLTGSPDTADAAAAGSSSSVASVAAPFSAAAVIVAFIIPFALAIVVAGLGSRPRFKAFFASGMGAAAGALGGFMVLPMRVIQSGPGTLASWLFAPWLWLYIAAGVSAFVFSQKAYGAGSLGQVAPAFYGMQVLWPAVASYAVFSTPFAPLQALAFAAIAAAVFFMARPVVLRD